MDSKFNRLEALLRQAQLQMPASGGPSASSELQDVFTRICKLVLDGQVYQELWDEPILSQLDWFFQVKLPNANAFGGQVAELRQRAQQVQRVTDCWG